VSTFRIVLATRRTAVAFPLVASMTVACVQAQGMSGAPEFNIDRPGFNLRNFDLNEADYRLCDRACAGDPKCRAWTYVRPGVQGPRAQCWLKHSVPATRASNCCTSGVKQAAAPSSPNPAPSGAIHIIAATYGGNCRAPRGNVTGHLASSCEGRTACSYRIDYRVIGDPARGCSKDYIVEWSCGGVLQRNATAPAEAGGGKQVLNLSCLGPGGGGGGPASGGGGSANVPGPAPGWISSVGRQNCVSAGSTRPGGLSCVAPASMPDHGTCADARAQRVIDSWLSRTRHASGAPLDCWGRWYGRTATAVTRDNCQRPDTGGRSRCQYVLDIFGAVHSKQLGQTLSAYVRRNLN
jgi:hypothetical protein